MLVEDVAQARPSIGALLIACQRIRRTACFLPAVSEVFKSVKSADASLDDMISDFGRLPHAVRQAREYLAACEHADCKRAQMVAEREAQKKGYIRQLLEAGMDEELRKFRFCEIFDVKKEIAAERGEPFPKSAGKP